MKDLPTPPLPDKTNIFLRTFCNLSAITATSGSGPLGVDDAHIFWFGQPEKFTISLNQTYRAINLLPCNMNKQKLKWVLNSAEPTYWLTLACRSRTCFFTLCSWAMFRRSWKISGKCSVTHCYLLHSEVSKSSKLFSKSESKSSSKSSSFPNFSVSSFNFKCASKWTWKENRR